MTYTHTQSPSIYCGFRRKALEHTLQSVSSTLRTHEPTYIYGDFNFRLDFGAVVKVRPHSHSVWSGLIPRLHSHSVWSELIPRPCPGAVWSALIPRSQPSAVWFELIPRPQPSAVWFELIPRLQPSICLSLQSCETESIGVGLTALLPTIFPLSLPISLPPAPHNNNKPSHTTHKVRPWHGG